MAKSGPGMLYNDVIPILAERGYVACDAWVTEPRKLAEQGFVLYHESWCHPHLDVDSFEIVQDAVEVDEQTYHSGFVHTFIQKTGPRHERSVYRDGSNFYAAVKLATLDEDEEVEMPRWLEREPPAKQKEHMKLLRRIRKGQIAALKKQVRGR